MPESTSGCGAVSRRTDEFPDDIFVCPVDLEHKLRHHMQHLLEDIPNIYLVPPVNYQAFVFLMQLSHLVMTDSGTIQEEAPGLDKPVLVMREVTERPEGVDAGTVRLVGTDPERIVSEAERLLTDSEFFETMRRAHNPYGDGQASQRILDALARS